MSDELLRHYNQELLELRELGREFAARHGAVAERLGIGPESTPDPHVERMLQGFAFLTARIRRKLDDTFPEVSDAMLATLYPHYLAPIPSMAIVQFALRADKAEQLAGIVVPRGTALESEPVDGEAVRFRTAYDTRVFPVQVAAASLGGLPFNASKLRFRGAAAALRVRLQCLSPSVQLAQMPAMWPLRFHLKGADAQANAIYEAILNDTIAVGVGSGVDDKDIVFAGPECIRAVGFDAEHGLLPYPPNAFVGYRLLTEYFCYSRKFMFFDVAPAPEAIARLGNVGEVIFYLSRPPGDLEQQVTRDVFRLGCTPVVNLYDRRAEPITLTNTQSSYRVIPDARAEQAHEVYSVNEVLASSTQGKTAEYLPLYSFRRNRDERAAASTFYNVDRRLTSAIGASARVAGRTSGSSDALTSDVSLSLVDLNFDPRSSEEWTLNVTTTCLNRDLPSKLPYGPGQPRLQLQGIASLVVECLTKPTPTLRAGVGDANRWRLISHLTLNQFSVAGDELGAEALRHVLRLYDSLDVERTRAAVDSIASVTSRRTVGRSPGAAAVGFARGTEVTVRFDDARFSDNGLFVFASVLERFLGLYCSINSFSQMVARTTSRGDKELRRWPPRAGDQILL